MNSRTLAIRVGQQLASATAGLVTGLLTARWLGPEGKGLLAIFLLVSTIGSQVSTMGLHDAASFLRRRRSFSLGRLTKIFDLFSLTWGVVASCAIAGATYLFGGRFWTYPIGPLLAIMTGALVFFKLSGLLSKGLLLAEQRFGSVAVLDLSDGILPGIGFMAMAIFVHPTASVAAFSFLLAGAAIAFSARARIAVISRVSEPDGPSPTAEMFRYGVPMYLRQIGQMAMVRGDVLIVGHLLGVAAVGLYSVAITLSEVVVRIPDAVGWMLMPKAASVTDDLARNMTAKYSRLALLVTAGISIPYALSALVVIPILLPRFEVSAIILACLMPGIVLSSITRIISADLVGRGKAGVVAKMTWMIFATVMAMDLTVIPRFGLIGAAAVSTVAQLLGAGVMARVYANESGLRIRDLFVVRNTDLVNWSMPSLKILWRASTGRAHG